MGDEETIGITVRQFDLLANLLDRTGAPHLAYVDHHGPWGIRTDGATVLEHLVKWRIGKRKLDDIRTFVQAATAAGKRIYFERGTYCGQASITSVEVDATP